MSLSLPADVEVFLTDGYDQLHDPAVYALVLERPGDVAEAWDQEFDARPPWFDEFQDARAVWYVGATNDCLSRLEDHRDGEVRVGVLQRVCEIESLRNVWWMPSTDKAFERESRIGLRLRRHLPETFVWWS